MSAILRAPFPWFGGKSRAAAEVWRAFGPGIANFVEPFAGSLAVLLGRPGGAGKIETVNDRDRYLCVAPETRVLMRDLTWRSAGALKPGDELLAFDEENPGQAREGFRAPSKYRRWRHSDVVAAPRVKLPCYRLTFDDGTTIVASEDHCWLAGSHKTGAGGRGWRWVKTKSLVCNRKTQRSWVLKTTHVAERRDDWETGWIAGIFDGEGSVIAAPAVKVCVSQNPGPVLDRIEAWLTANGFDFERDASKRCVRVTIRGGLKEQLRFLMLARPVRLLRRFAELVPECSLYGREHSAVGLVSKEYLGEQEVIALSTTTRTFVAEGLASHNCNFWRAIALDPYGVAAWADSPVNEADLHARHKWLVNQAEFRERMHTDPEYFDVKIAGWWVNGLCQWIGGGWCVEPNNHKHPKLDGIGKGVHSNRGHAPCEADHRKRPELDGTAPGRGVHSDAGHSKQLPSMVPCGVHGHHSTRGRAEGSTPPHEWEQRPHMSGTPDGVGVHRKIPNLAVGGSNGDAAGRGMLSEAAVSEQASAYSSGRRPQLSTGGQGVHLPSLGNDRGIHGVSAPGTFHHALQALSVPDAPPCFPWFAALALRLRRVRVACGDWTRVLGPSVLGKGKNVGGRRPCAVFLDPPYSHELRDPYLYSEDDPAIAAKVRDWALDHGNDPDLRIALCGYAGEHEMPGWTEHEWKASRGYAGADNENRKLERIWFSPHCLPIEEQRSLFSEVGT